MAEDHKFRRNLILIAFAHLALVAGFYVFSLFQPRAKVEEVMWLDGGSSGGGENSEPTPDPPLPPPPPEPEPPPKRTEPPAPIEPVPPPPSEPPIESELSVPKATPTPKPTTPKPKPATPKPTPKATPRTTPKPAAKTTPKPAAKASPKPGNSAKKSASAKPKGTPGTSKKVTATRDSKASGLGPAAKGEGTGQGSGKGAGYEGGGARDSEFAPYFRMIHDRLHGRWEQPTSIARSGTDYVTTLRLRIAPDGTILAREIVSESGNSVMDESVLTAGNRVTQIDPLPKGLGNGEFFEIKVNFKLDQGSE